MTRMATTISQSSVRFMRTIRFHDNANGIDKQFGVLLPLISATGSIGGFENRTVIKTRPCRSNRDCLSPAIS